MAIVCVRFNSNRKMELFEREVDPKKNWLPYDGIVNYYGTIYDHQKASSLTQVLLNNIEWRADEAVIFGKKIVTKRKVAWYADKPLPYRYSGTTKTALPWIQQLESIKTKVEDRTGESFNSCLLNLYHSGEEGMAWHSDGERELRKNGAIASISLGAERKFCFKHKQTKQVINLQLEHGSLLIMKDSTQTHWLHRLPPTKKVRDLRVNLTFRQIVGGK